MANALDRYLLQFNKKIHWVLGNKLAGYGIIKKWEFRKKSSTNIIIFLGIQ